MDSCLEPRSGSFLPACDAGESDPLHEAFGPELAWLGEQIARVAPQDTTVLLTGETGTGKTRLARFLHQHSPRREEPFLLVDCGALSSSLIESEMFGHVKGSFTGAERDRAGKLATVGQGTLVLDEINSLPLPLQSKLLRAVEERVFEPVGSDRPLPLRARLVAISNVRLEEQVVASHFRADLYYRLNVVGFYLPPLRERRPVVAPLALKFLAEFIARDRPDVTGIAADAVRALEAYHWPGNVRELRNVVERAVALTPGPRLGVRDLPEGLWAGATCAPPLPVQAEPLRAMTLPAPRPEPLNLMAARQEAEIWRIKEALAKHGNNRVRTAAELGISRMALYKKLEKYRLK